MNECVENPAMCSQVCIYSEGIYICLYAISDVNECVETPAMCSLY